MGDRTKPTRLGIQCGAIRTQLGAQVGHLPAQLRRCPCLLGDLGRQTINRVLKTTLSCLSSSQRSAALG